MKFEVPLDGLLLKVVDVKSRVQSLICIAVSRQSLYFTNHTTIAYYQVSDETLIQVDAITDHSFFSLLIRYPSAVEFASNQNVFSVLCKLATSKRFEYFEVGLRSPVEELKFKIANREMTHPSFYKVFLNGIELEDQWVMGNLKGIYRDDAVIESCFINGEASRMGIPIPRIAVVFAPMQIQVQRTLTFDCRAQL